MAELDAHAKLIIDIRTLMKQRDAARAGADFGKSDTIRERLSGMGVVIKDQIGGPSGWKFLDGRSNKLPAGVKQSQIPVAAQKTRVPEVGDKRGRDDGSGQSDKKNKKLKTDGASAKDKTKGGMDKQKEKEKVKPVKEAPRQQSVEEQRNKSALSAIGGDGKGKNVNGVLIEVLKEGSGTRQAENGQRVKMGYVGRLTNGRTFDSSKDRPFAFKLGRSEVIKGWDIGVLHMKIGEKRRLTIPPEKGYGKQGSPPTIPPNATLVFEVTLIDIM